MSAPRSVYLKLQQQIEAAEGGGIMQRWNYGRALLKEKAGRQQLPDGKIDGLIKAAGLRTNGKPRLSETEIQRRIKLATVYATDQQVRQILTDLGTWTAIISAGFPSVVDPDPEEMAEGHAPDEWEQLSLLPGFKPLVKLRGKEVPLAQTTVGDLVAYRDKYRHMHEGFEKTLALISETVATLLDGCGGDLSVNSLDAWRAGTEPIA